MGALTVQCFHHLPGLAIADGAQVAALEGHLRRLAFKEFAVLDPDWAHENYFVQGTGVWVCEPTSAKAFDLAKSADSAELLRLAAMAELQVPLPMPTLSMSYAREGEATKRHLGPFERTLMLADHNVIEASPGELARVASTARAWQVAGFNWKHPIFSALSAFGAIYTALGRYPVLRAMPVMVALEGLFASKAAPNIARRMAENLKVVLTDAALLDDKVKSLYAVRSDLVHGRPVDETVAEHAFFEAGTLACRATGALVSLVIQRGLRASAWQAVREGWK